MYRTLYHMDSDGFASAGVVYKHLRASGVKEEDMKFHPIQYGMELPEEIDYEKDTVYLVDFSLQPLMEMVQFANLLGDRLIWIDHHSTSVDMENEDAYLKNVSGVRQVEWEEGTPISGCELAWKYLFMNDKMPHILRLVGDWDTWRWNKLPLYAQEQVKELQLALYLADSKPNKEKGREFWRRHLTEGVDVLGTEMFQSGKLLLAYRAKQWRSTVGALSFEADFKGLRAVMVNQKGNSEMFEGYFDPEKHDVMVTFQLVQGKYLTVSLYGVNPEIHLGHLAKRLGEAGDKPSGGGHAGAAGFQCSWDYFSTLYDVKDEEDEEDEGDSAR